MGGWKWCAGSTAAAVASVDNARNTETVPDGHATSGGYGLLPQTVGLKSHGSDLVRRGEGDRARMRHGRAAVLGVTAL